MTRGTPPQPHLGDVEAQEEKIMTRLVHTERKAWAERICDALRSVGLSVEIEEESAIVDRGSSTAGEDVDWETRRRATRYSVMVDDSAAVARMKAAKKANPANPMKPQAEMDSHILAVWISALRS